MLPGRQVLGHRVLGLGVSLAGNVYPEQVRVGEAALLPAKE